MKNKQRLTALLSAAVLTAGCAAALPETAAQAAGSYQHIVVLGDSISSGYQLGTGEAGYYDILADCTGGTVTNYAVAGHTTADLLGVIADSSKQNAIKNADLICISIGGNDLMKPAKAVLDQKRKAGETMIDTIKRLAKEGKPDELIAELTSELRKPRSAAVTNFSQIEQDLRALNPNAAIVMQTLYNPFEVSEAMLKAQLSEANQKNYQSLLNYVSGNEKILNNAINKLETVSVADVSSNFNGSGWLYTRFTNNATKGDVHPNAAGHALIAATVMDTLGNVAGTSQKTAQALNNMLRTDFAELPADDLALMSKYAAAETALCGDADVNGTVGGDDAQITLQWYVNLLAGKQVAKTQREFSISDVNANGVIGADDAQFILQFYVNRLAGKTSKWATVTGNPKAPVSTALMTLK